MREGPGLKSIGMGVSKAAYDLTPMEEVRALAQEGDQLDAAQKTRLIFTGIAKTAGLLAGAKGAAELPTRTTSCDKPEGWEYSER